MPDPRNARHQRYCGSAPCKAASKRASQEKWLAKPENQNYFRGPDAVARVKAWREAHPGYSRRPEPPGNVPVQEDLPLESPPAEPSQAEEIAPPQISCNALPGKPATPLQDLLNAQPIVLIGLIAHLFDATLQDSIGETLHRLIQLGLDIRGGRSDEYDETATESERQRQVPAHFSWLDHRLVREHYIEKADACAWALYLFLVTVADANGLSYYGEASLSRRLQLDGPRLARAPGSH